MPLRTQKTSNNRNNWPEDSSNPGLAISLLIDKTTSVAFVFAVVGLTVWNATLTLTKI